MGLGERQREFSRETRTLPRASDRAAGCRADRVNRAAAQPPGI